MIRTTICFFMKSVSLLVIHFCTDKGLYSKQARQRLSQSFTTVIFLSPVMWTSASLASFSSTAATCLPVTKLSFYPWLVLTLLSHLFWVYIKRNLSITFFKSMQNFSVYSNKFYNTSLRSACVHKVVILKTTTSKVGKRRKHRNAFHLFNRYFIFYS